MAEEEASTKEAANMLGMSDSWVRGQIRAGHLPAKRIGQKKWRIRVSDLEAL